MSDDLRISGFVDLAIALARPIILFDLESTTFRGRPNFGITEACFLTAVVTKGAAGAVQYGSLVNPEARIEPKVQELTGITQAMVDKEKPWNRSFMKHFFEWAPHAYFTGFNSDTFDIPAVKDQAKRYGAAAPDFKHTFDVRQLHLKLSGAESRKGTLVEVAAEYGVKPRGSLHRATADTVLTAETLSIMVHAFGVDEVCQYIHSNAKQDTAALTTHNVARYLKSQRARTVSELAELFKVEESKVAYETGKAVDERLLADPFVLSDPSEQQWLLPAVQSLSQDVRNCGKLKLIHSALQEAAPEGKRVDYLQLRLALLNANLGWSTLRAA